ncbi:hypothetical protein BLOT_003170 [Blomia tropicalis]|nr:hypothetical protein BLOT_003170 [Blomia tropicalis]
MTCLWYKGGKAPVVYTPIIIESFFDKVASKTFVKLVTEANLPLQHIQGEPNYVYARNYSEMSEMLEELTFYRNNCCPHDDE